MFNPSNDSETIPVFQENCWTYIVDVILTETKPLSIWRNFHRWIIHWFNELRQSLQQKYSKSVYDTRARSFLKRWYKYSHYYTSIKSLESLLLCRICLERRSLYRDGPWHAATKASWRTSTSDLMCSSRAYSPQLRVLMVWCFSTMALVATTLSTHPWVSSRLWVTDQHPISCLVNIMVAYGLATQGAKPFVTMEMSK